MVGPWRVVWPLLVASGLALIARPVSAGSLTHLRDYLGRQQANLPAGQSHQVFFSPNTSLPGSTNTVVFQFPDGDDGTWCRIAGSDLVVSGMTNPVGATENATPLPGTLTADCTIGAGGGSIDTITVSGVGPLTAGTVYGWSVSDGATATLGTPPPAQGLMVTLSTTNGTSTIDSMFFFLSVITSDQVSITAVVANTTPPSPTNPTVIFNGYAAPGATVTALRDSTLAGSTISDRQAKFSITLTDQPTGAIVYVLSGADSDGRSLTAMTFALSLGLSTTTIINGVFLGPSIAIDKNSVKIGTPVTISGTTAPTSLVTLTVSSPHATSFSLTADSQGRWSKVVNTTSIGVGQHSAQAQALLDGTAASEISAAVMFAVNALGQCDNRATGDLNCDARVDLIDFSVLLFFWRQTNPNNERVDSNHDGTVNIVDFSIMLFQWTG